MLILSRKRGEVIQIEQDITIMVVEIRGDKVRLGIDAPPDVQVNRTEVIEAIQREGKRDKSSDRPRDPNGGSVIP